MRIVVELNISIQMTRIGTGFLYIKSKICVNQYNLYHLCAKKIYEYEP
jgi:hypothetical protein